MVYQMGTADPKDGRHQPNILANLRQKMFENEENLNLMGRVAIGGVHDRRVEAVKEWVRCVVSKRSVRW